MPATATQAARMSDELELETIESPVTVSTIDPQEIARLAYSYWEARGRAGGCAEDDWLRAEEALKAGSGPVG